MLNYDMNKLRQMMQLYGEEYDALICGGSVLNIDDGYMVDCIIEKNFLDSKSDYADFAKAGLYFPSEWERWDYYVECLFPLIEGEITWEEMVILMAFTIAKRCKDKVDKKQSLNVGEAWRRDSDRVEYYGTPNRADNMGAYNYLVDHRTDDDKLFCAVEAELRHVYDCERARD